MEILIIHLIFEKLTLMTGFVVNIISVCCLYSESQRGIVVLVKQFNQIASKPYKGLHISRYIFLTLDRKNPHSNTLATYQNILAIATFIHTHKQCMQECFGQVTLAFEKVAHFGIVSPFNIMPSRVTQRLNHQQQETPEEQTLKRSSVHTHNKSSCVAIGAETQPENRLHSWAQPSSLNPPLFLREKPQRTGPGHPSTAASWCKVGFCAPPPPPPPSPPRCARSQDGGAIVLPMQTFYKP